MPPSRKPFSAVICPRSSEKTRPKNDWPAIVEATVHTRKRMVALPGIESDFFTIRDLPRNAKNTGFSALVSPLFAT
jgi:hypothetical protein